MVICLERRVHDLQTVQLKPLPPRHLLLHGSPDWFNLSDAGLPGCPGKEAIKWVSVCLCRVNVFYTKLWFVWSLFL